MGLKYQLEKRIHSITSPQNKPLPPHTPKLIDHTHQESKFLAEWQQTGEKNQKFKVGWQKTNHIITLVPTK